MVVQARRVFAIVFSVLTVVAVVAATGGTAAELTNSEVADFSRKAIFAGSETSGAAADKLVARGEKDVLAALILALRFRRNDPALLKAVTTLSGNSPASWKEAMEWQEAHPEIVPHDSFRDIKLELLNQIDPNFLRFLGKDRGLRQNLGIRLEEIVWGGVRVDGIPALDDPKLIAADQADYLLDGDLVFGVDINGDVRAYPLRIMGWHEMFNETIGGVPVALAYCTLCGAGILFETKVDGHDEPFRFGSSGLLYRSNKLMFDRQTDSLWNQFTGEPVSGPLRDSGIRLKMRPVAITSWANWWAQNPDTKVLSLDTGHRRDYGSGVVYRDYFASPDLMFPSIVADESIVKRKDYVFGIRTVGAAKAWPVKAFAGGKVINDAVGNLNVVLIGNAETRTVRAYERGDASFGPAGSPATLAGPGGVWSVTESALVGAEGQKLPRVPGHVSYWFAWDSYLGGSSELFADR